MYERPERLKNNGCLALWIDSIVWATIFQNTSNRLRLLSSVTLITLYRTKPDIFDYYLKDQIYILCLFCGILFRSILLLSATFILCRAALPRNISYVTDSPSATRNFTSITYRG
jgi:hypothetical protein